MTFDLTAVVAGIVAIALAYDNYSMRRSNIESDKYWDNEHLVMELKDHLNIEDRDNIRLREEIRSIFGTAKEKGLDLRGIVENGVNVNDGRQETVQVTKTVSVSGPATDPGVASAVRAATTGSSSGNDSRTGGAGVPPTKTA